VDLVRGDALTLPFGPVFDLVVSFGAFGHIQRQDELRFVGEVFRVLRPGGRFVFIASPWPKPWSLGYWMARGFNAAMRIRNFLIRPPFIMYYLTFMLPETQDLLQRQGFAVEVSPLGFRDRWANLRLVCATKPDPARLQESG